MKLTTLLTIAGLWSGFLAAQPQQLQWHHLDPKTDSVMGISTERAYRELLRGRTATPVMVAVIDAGVDIDHEDLQSVIGTNPKEIAGNGKDDDRNGYVDDVHGWNFLGDKDGHNVEFYQREETRMVARLGPRYATANRDSLPADQQADYDLYQQAKSRYDQDRKEITTAYDQYSPMATSWENAIADLKKGLGVVRLDSALLHHPPTTDSTLLAKAAILYRPVERRFADADKALAALQKGIKGLKAQLDYAYNLQYDPQLIVSDHPDNLTEMGYGNADVTGPEAHYGTHVAGIIAANRTNQIGTRGIADHACIICVRAAPLSGDERDKDIANAIRYAVDKGAKIINMSFGKNFSPDRQVVDEAIRYADTQGVLLVHIAGNDRSNNDSIAHYPATAYPDGLEMTNMITVGASSGTNGRDLATNFSN